MGELKSGAYVGLPGRDGVRVGAVACVGGKNTNARAGGMQIEAGARE